MGFFIFPFLESEKTVHLLAKNELKRNVMA